MNFVDYFSGDLKKLLMLQRQVNSKVEEVKYDLFRSLPDEEIKELIISNIVAVLAFIGGVRYKRHALGYVNDEGDHPDFSLSYFSDIMDEKLLRVLEAFVDNINMYEYLNLSVGICVEKTTLFTKLINTETEVHDWYASDDYYADNPHYADRIEKVFRENVKEICDRAPYDYVLAKLINNDWGFYSSMKTFFGEDRKELCETIRSKGQKAIPLDIKEEVYDLALKYLKVEGSQPNV